MSELIQSLIIAGVAMIPGFIALYAQRKKTKAEAEKEEAEASDKITQTALILIQPLKVRIEELEEELSDLRAAYRIMRDERDELICGIDKLIAQMESAVMVPVWRPKRVSSYDVPTRPNTKKKDKHDEL